MRQAMMFCGVVAASAALVAAVWADDEKVALDKLPKAVVEAVKAKFPKGELVRAVKEEGDGMTFFEVSIKTEGKAVDVTLTPEGKIVMLERVIPIRQLPKVIVDAAKANYPKSRIVEAEEVTEDDKVTGYTVQVVTAEKKIVEARFDLSGKLVEEDEAQ